MPVPVLLRLATADDAAILAEHRVAMFREMDAIDPSLEADLRVACVAYFAAAISAGEYIGWIGHLPEDPAPVCGAGLQFRSLLPRPSLSSDALLLGREGLVLNVYTAHAWRRRGIARFMMETIITWAGDHGIVRLVLGASTEGRPLYQKLGFAGTREMSYSGALAPTGPWTGDRPGLARP